MRIDSYRCIIALPGCCTPSDSSTKKEDEAALSMVDETVARSPRLICGDLQ